MLVLEATSEMQGDRDDDYHWCNDGELAYLQGVSCASPTCGCDRGWAGFESHRATTTVRVVHRPGLTVEQFAQDLAISLCDGGWISTPSPSDELVSVFVDQIIDMANYFGEGAVLEHNGDEVRRRVDAAESAILDWVQRN